MKVAIQGEMDGEIRQILVEDGRILQVGTFSRGELSGFRLIDTNCRLVPGYIDVHVHGGAGAETMDATDEAFRHICQLHAKHGTTALLLTTITESDAAIERVMRAYRPDLQTNGAEILGFHIEGPFINPAKPGAQPKQFISPPSAERLRRWMALSGGCIRYLTMAPEMDGAADVIEEAKKLGIIVSAGHSNATYQEACTAYAQGVRSTTHLFNAMSGLNHREPGLVGAALDTRDAYVELIADTYHVHPAAMRIAIREKGLDRVMLITDAVRAAGMPENEYEFGDQRVIFRNGTVRLADGTLAGSGLTLDKAVRNLLECRALDSADVPRVTSRNQATLFGLPHGKLDAGRPANVIAVDPQWHVTHTFVRGELVFQA